MRTALVLAAVSSIAFAASACNEDGRPRPTVARVYADGALGQQVQSIAAEFLTPRGVTVEAVTDLAQADVAVTSVAANENTPSFVVRYWVPVVALPSRADNLSMGQLSDILVDNTTDWSSITGEAMALRVIIPIDVQPPVGQWGLAVTADQAMRVSEVPAALDADTGAIAVLPLDAVTAGVRSLAVDDVNIVFGTGDLASYPLTERVYVNQAAVSGDLRELLDQLGTELDARLGAPAPDPIVLRATGDILPVRCTYAKIVELGGDFRLPFLKIGPWLAEADIAVGSLDASISDAGTPFGCEETFSLMAPAAAVEGLAYSGFDVITVATNHVKDCGQAACGDQAFFETLSNIQLRGIQTVGGGADLAQARAPAFVMAKGIRFAFLGYDEIAPYYHAEPGVPGTAPLDEASLREDVAAAWQQADVVIVEPQWGIEYQAEPTLTQQSLAAAAVESGATLIIGNHPHWVEAGQAIGTSFVAYALGNFVFDQDWSLETQQGVILEAVFHGKDLKGIRYEPVHIWDEHQPDFAEPAEAQQIMDRIWNASATLP